VRSEEHLHLVCRECNRVQDADADLGHALARAVEEQTGFQTDVRHMALHGLCAECAARARREATDGPATLRQI
jgi:Fur family ferric uptake transcriptional regulator